VPTSSSKIYPSHQVAYSNREVKIFCYSDQEPAWTFYKDKYELKLPEHIEVYSNHILIGKANIDDSGEYICSGIKSKENFIASSHLYVGGKLFSGSFFLCHL